MQMKIFHEFRVDIKEKQADSDKAGVRKRIVFNGVSANSWLSPIGGIANSGSVGRAAGGCYSGRSSDPINKRPSPRPTIHQVCHDTLQERAKSASGIVGRRHYEVPQQTLSKDTALKGNTLGRSLLGIQEGEMKQINNSQQRVGCVEKNLEFRVSFGGNRTAPEDRHRTCLRTSDNESASQPADDLTGLVIIPLKNKPDRDSRLGKLCVGAPDAAKARCLSANDVRQLQPVILDDKTISFRSLQAMCQAYQSRIKSAPPNLLTPKNQSQPAVVHCPVPLTEPTSHTSPSNNSVGTDPTPSTAAPGTSRRKPRQACQPRNRFQTESHTSAIPRRSSLRPLLYSQELESQHNSGCPHTCKGCFKACLASPKYFTEAEQKRNSFLTRRRLEQMASRKQIPVSTSFSAVRPAHRLHVVRRSLPDDFLCHPASQESTQQSNIYI